MPYPCIYRQLSDAETEIIILCRTCDKRVDFIVPTSQALARANGALVQDAFPTLDRGLREMFVNGICPECWKKLFGSEPE